MLQHILSIFAFVCYFFMFAVMLWQFLYKKQHNNYYRLFIYISLFLFAWQTIFVVQVFYAVLEQSFLGFSHSVYLVAWFVLLVLLAFSIFITAQTVLVAAIFFALVSSAIQIYLTKDNETFIGYDSWNMGINWHIIVAILSMTMLYITAICAFIISLVESKLKSGNIININMITTVSLQTLKRILYVLSWITWLLLGIVFISGLHITYSLLDQQLSHKVLFTFVAWLLMSIFLWAKHFSHLSNIICNRLLFISTFCVSLGYFGTRVVIDFLL